MKEILTQSKEMSHEYCCTVVRLGEIIPIEGANTVAKTIVNGREIVIGKERKEGDIMIYASNECQLNDKFMSINNLYEDYTLNSNYEEVNKWFEQNTDATDDERKEYLRQRRGYFDKHARVRMKKLCGTMSMGFLFDVDLLRRWKPDVYAITDWSNYVGIDFDTVGGELFVKAYVPEVKESTPRGSKDAKRNKKLKRFNRMIPGQFAFHYDTQQFEREITRFKPDDVVDVTIKLHGTSFITGNIKVKTPRWKGLYEKVFNYLPSFLQFTTEEYDIVESSRTVIINDSINPNKGVGFAGGQVQKAIAEYASIIGPYIPQDVTVYGEIVGYYPGSSTPIQKIGAGYDYGSKTGENQLMIYRVVCNSSEGKYEYTIQEVLGFTAKLKELLSSSENPENANRIRPIDVLYHGTFRDLYPDLDVENHWHENLLARLKVEPKFGMEQNEPFCKNKVPREGIVIRIENDVVPEAFKLKCVKFLGKEAEAMDKGDVSDAEMQERY